MDRVFLGMSETIQKTLRYKPISPGIPSDDLRREHNEWAHRFELEMENEKMLILQMIHRMSEHVPHGEMPIDIKRLFDEAAHPLERSFLKLTQPSQYELIELQKKKDEHDKKKRFLLETEQKVKSEFNPPDLVISHLGSKYFSGIAKTFKIRNSPNRRVVYGFLVYFRKAVLSHFAQFLIDRQSFEFTLNNIEATRYDEFFLECTKFATVIGNTSTYPEKFVFALCHHLLELSDDILSGFTHSDIDYMTDVLYARLNENIIEKVWGSGLDEEIKKILLSHANRKLLTSVIDEEERTKKLDKMGDFWIKQGCLKLALMTWGSDFNLESIEKYVTQMNKMKEFLKSLDEPNASMYYLLSIKSDFHSTKPMVILNPTNSTRPTQDSIYRNLLINNLVLHHHMEKELAESLVNWISKSKVNVTVPWDLLLACIKEFQLIHDGVEFLVDESNTPFDFHLYKF